MLHFIHFSPEVLFSVYPMSQSSFINRDLCLTKFIHCYFCIFVSVSLSLSVCLSVCLSLSSLSLSPLSLCLSSLSVSLSLCLSPWLSLSLCDYLTFYVCVHHWSCFISALSSHGELLRLFYLFIVNLITVASLLIVMDLNCSVLEVKGVNKYFTPPWGAPWTSSSVKANRETLDISIKILKFGIYPFGHWWEVGCSDWVWVFRLSLSVREVRVLRNFRVLEKFECWGSLGVGEVWMLRKFGCWGSLNVEKVWMLRKFECWGSLGVGEVWALRKFGCWRSLNVEKVWMLRKFECWLLKWGHFEFWKGERGALSRRFNYWEVWILRGVWVVSAICTLLSPPNFHMNSEKWIIDVESSNFYSKCKLKLPCANPSH